MEDTKNWASDVLKMPVMKWVDPSAPELGVILTDTFANFAKDNDISYVAFQFKKGKAKEMFWADSVNCPDKDFKELIEKIKQMDVEEK